MITRLPNDKLRTMCRTLICDNSPIWECMGVKCESHRGAMINGMLMMARFLGDQEAEDIVQSVILESGLNTRDGMDGKVRAGSKWKGKKR